MKGYLIIDKRLGPLRYQRVGGVSAVFVFDRLIFQCIGKHWRFSWERSVW